MNKPQNLPSTSLQRDKTTDYFNNYYQPTPEISIGKYDSIISYFQQKTGDIDSAKLMTQAVIDTANAQRADPIEVLNYFKSSENDTEFGLILALYMNSARVNTSLLGYNVPPKINSYVERNIVF